MSSNIDDRRDEEPAGDIAPARETRSARRRDRKPRKASRQKRFGPPMVPNGDGYMPFSNAMHWIASKGGDVAVKCTNEAFRPAFDDLVNGISSRKIRGLWNNLKGEPMPVDPSKVDVQMLFAGDRSSVFGYPNTSFIECSLVLGWDRHEEYWQRSFSDKLVVGEDIQFTHLRVMEADIRARWPFHLMPVVTEPGAANSPAVSISSLSSPTVATNSWTVAPLPTAKASLVFHSGFFRRRPLRPSLREFARHPAGHGPVEPHQSILRSSP
jgi:hypothetical protein